MSDQTKQPLDDATEALAAELRAAPGSLEPVYEHLDALLAQWRADGIAPVDVLPAAKEPGLGFSLRSVRNGKTFWDVLFDTSRSSLCSADGQLRNKLTSVEAQAGGGTVATGVMISLGLPPVAGPVAAAIASVILVTGLDSFCSWTESPSEPGPA